VKAAEDGAVRRALRRFTLGSGPLKRRSDRVQVVGRVLLVVSFLVSPWIAVATTTAVTADLQRTAEVQAAERSQVRAVLLEAARPADDVSYVDAVERPPRAPAAWTGPDGRSREGTVPAPLRAGAGDTVLVWVDRDGEVTRAPLDPAGIRGTAAAIGVLPLVGVPIAAWALYALLCFALDARRDRRWGEDWAAVEPVWNPRPL
jgi:hypothetical protein